MKEYQQYTGANVSLSFFKRCVEELCSNVGVSVPDYNTISRYYFNRDYSPVDVFRMTNDKLKIKGAKVTIEWIDQYGHGSRDFTHARQIREFLEDFPVLKEQLQRGAATSHENLQSA
ncbi:MAG: hypothetical protein RIC06_10200 [Cyclobacteriaceae bacterium]